MAAVTPNPHPMRSEFQKWAAEDDTAGKMPPGCLLLLLAGALAVLVIITSLTPLALGRLLSD